MRLPSSTLALAQDVRFAEARDARSYAFDYDTIICTEVLEHIDADLNVIRNWKAGAWRVCTVSNFDWECHVRFFRSSEEVRERFGELINIETRDQRSTPGDAGRKRKTIFAQFAVESE